MSEIHISAVKQQWWGTRRVPADKSISHRAAILGALADGDVRVSNFLKSETTAATVRCLRSLGVDLDWVDEFTLLVHGRGLRSLREPADVLSCSGSGTTMRLLAGVCAGQDFISILDGSQALKRRPMHRVVEPLRAMGATIMARDGGRLPPLAIRGGRLHGIDYMLPVASAQVKSALLLAGLFADSPTTVREPAPSRDHTERMLQSYGIRLEILDAASDRAPQVKVWPAERLDVPDTLSIPGDFSSAAFPLVAALLIPGSEICIERVGVNPTRTGLLDALGRMGARVLMENVVADSGEPVADLIIQSRGDLIATEVSGDQVPTMIDEFPILGVAATQARGETLIRDAQELRVKESDRIAMLALELGKMGAQIQERPDGFVVTGPTPLYGACVSAHDDHRLAMSLAVAALIAEGETVIEGWECVADSYPNFGELISG